MRIRSIPYAAALALCACRTPLPLASDGGGPDLAAHAVDAAAPRTELSVLFLGNSYTYVNDLPGQVRDLAASAGAGPTLAVDSIANAGWTLQQHLDDPATRAKLGARRWSFVVLQGQSVEPLLDPAGFESAADGLSAEVKSIGATTVFYETWARRKGDPVYDQPWAGATPREMQDGLRQAYQDAADNNRAEVAPAGDAWERALAEPAPPPLFQADGSHPTVHGTYLIGCVFYRRLTGRAAQGLEARPAGVSPDEALTLQDLADRSVP